MCPRTGMPSQFTLRWFVKAGMCCAYPFGYCHGDSVFEEAAIKTKLECEELCLGRVDSGKNLHIIKVNKDIYQKFKFQKSHTIIEFNSIDKFFINNLRVIFL